MENEREEAKAEAQVTRLAAIAAGDSKAQAEEELARVQDALADAEETRHMDEAKASRLEVK